jgi:predicted small integral membrane protein
MTHFTSANAIRRSKILIVFMAFLFGLVTLTNNFTDYAVYSDYIRQIISMSDTQGNDSRRYRGVTSMVFHHRFYWTIITLEIIFTFSFLIGTYQLCQKLRAPREEFHEAKKFAVVGFGTALFVYQTLYVIILNEWFDMDYSSQRSAFEWARNNIEYMFLALIYLLVAKDD